MSAGSKKISEKIPMEGASPKSLVPDLDLKLSCGLSRREILQMRRAGMAKPDFVTWADWNGPKKLSHRHMLVAHLAALGYGHKDIARATNISPQQVSNLVNSEILKDTIRQVREVEMQGLGVDQKISQLSSQAIRIYEHALYDPGVRIRDKLRVADAVLDRKLGKPQQRVEIQGSLIGEFYAMLKKLDSSSSASSVVSSNSDDFEDITDAELLDSDSLLPAEALLPPDGSLLETLQSPRAAESFSDEGESTQAEQMNKWIEENF
jgi:hypothetical protein